MTTDPTPIPDHVIKFHDDVERVVAAADFGQPTAAKRGRNPRFPYVPIVDYRNPTATRGGHTTQLRGLAFATRVEAVDAARESIDANRRRLLNWLLDPRARANREALGLPRELPR